MSIQLTNFTKSYQDIVSELKKIKLFNQKMYESLAQHRQNNEKSLYINYNVDVELKHLQTIRKKILQWISDTERSYLDPMTARRVEIVKQQLQTQWERNGKLAKELNTALSGNKGKNLLRETNQEIFQSQDQQSFNQLQQFDHEHEKNLLKVRNEQLAKAHNKLLNIHNITKQTKQLTFQQGQKLDIIDEHMNRGVENTKEANKQLQEASNLQKKAQKKCVWVLIAIGALVAIITIVLIAVF